MCKTNPNGLFRSTHSKALSDARGSAACLAPRPEGRRGAGSRFHTLHMGVKRLLVVCVLAMLGTTVVAQNTPVDPPAFSDNDTTGIVIDRSAFIFGGYGSRATRNLDLEKKIRDFNRMRTQKAISYFVFAQEAMAQQNIPLAAMHNTFSLQVMPTEDGWVQRYIIMSDAGMADEALASLMQAINYSIDDYYRHLYEGIETAAGMLDIEADLDDRTLYESLEAELSDYLIELNLADGYYNVLPGRSDFDSTLLEMEYVSRYLEFFFGSETYRVQANAAIGTALSDHTTKTASPAATPVSVAISSPEDKRRREGDVETEVEAQLDIENKTKAGAEIVGEIQNQDESEAVSPASPSPYHSAQEHYIILLGPYDRPLQAILNQARLQVLFPKVKIIYITD